jgi:hypothetical protein
MTNGKGGRGENLLVSHMPLMSHNEETDKIATTSTIRSYDTLYIQNTQKTFFSDSACIALRTKFQQSITSAPQACSILRPLHGLIGRHVRTGFIVWLFVMTAIRVVKTR